MIRTPITTDGPIDLRAALDAAEKRAAETALALHGDNQRKAAAHLGLSYNQMRGLVRKHALSARRRNGEAQASDQVVNS